MDIGKLWDKYGIYFTLLFMMLMMVSYSIEWLRLGVGQGLDTAFAPIVQGFNIPFYILILILATLTGLYSAILQKYMIDYDRMADAQERMKEFQKEFREAQLSQDEKRIKKLDARKERVMREQLELSQQNFKPMGFILILTVPIFFWLLYRLSQTHATITFPFAGTLELHNTVLWVLPAWMFWYILVSLVISQVIRKSLNIGGM
jgi:uncharacterized membrane protein (DUF106 family)